MAESPLPSVFVSHGPPTLVLDDDPARDFLVRLGAELPRPKAILCVSAHWLKETPAVTLNPRPETIHDFFGFDRALYDIAYPAPGDPELARRVAGLVEATGFACAQDPERGLDHGAWEPLVLMYPEADVPVVQLALMAGADAATHLRLGQALEPLRHEGVLVLASGTAVHNLAQWREDPAATPAWARAFDDWLAGAVARGDRAAIAGYLSNAPHAAMAHPSEDHFLPLPVAMGAGGTNGAGLGDAEPVGGGPGDAEPVGGGRTLYRGFSYGSLSMAAFAFGG
jgi:4,5-DOPA dioxygenase extradiol